jgi:NAD(P)H dehydrogenase (quinone)
MTMSPGSMPPVTPPPVFSPTTLKMTPDTMTVAISGVTGHIGGTVLRRLANIGEHGHIIGLVRDAARAPQREGVEIRVADYADADACEKALAGVDVFFMVSASEAEDRVAQHLNIIGAAAKAGVKHIVYTSFVGAGPDATFTLARDHGRTEDAIRASGMAFTILRNNFYLDVLPLFADESGVIRGPAGEGRVAAVARADVADVAIAVLRKPELQAGRTLELTGGEALTFAEVASRASVILEKPMTFVNETVEEAHASRAHYNAPAWQMDAWVSTYTAIAAGELEVVNGTVLMLTGHPPRTLEDVL